MDQKSNTIYYKVCTKKDDSYYSAAVHDEYKVKYEIGRFVRSPRSDFGLFVFSNLEDALAFAMPDQVILIAHIKNILELPDYRYAICGGAIVHTSKIVKDSPTEPPIWPAGTVMVDEVKILDEIKPKIRKINDIYKF